MTIPKQETVKFRNPASLNLLVLLLPDVTSKRGSS